MAPSQLKQLKASLRESGIIGPQQSKKKQRSNAKNSTNARDRIQRNAALDSIRERFNPFEVKASVKRVKFDVTTLGSKTDRVGSYVRPGVTKSLREERVSY
jgi:nucleolar protein 14